MKAEQKFFGNTVYESFSDFVVVRKFSDVAMSKTNKETRENSFCLFPFYQEEKSFPERLPLSRLFACIALAKTESNGSP